MGDLFLRVVAGLGVLSHVYFAYKETAGWSAAFVADVAPRWNAGRDASTVAQCVDWAKPLAANVAAYNAALALGLLWVALAGPAVADTLGRFLAAWLLIAAAAAALTGVRKATIVQGVLGILLLVASFMG
jgi:uncharacterized membrane protein